MIIVKVRRSKSNSARLYRLRWMPWLYGQNHWRALRLALPTSLRPNFITIGRGYGVPLQGRLARLSQATFGFYALQGQRVVEFMSDGKAPSRQTMLRAVRAANPQAKWIVLIWDNARSHLDRQVQALAWQRGIYRVALPTYSPNLNPIERVWKSIRYKLSPIGLIDPVDSLQTHIKTFFQTPTQSRSFATSWIERLLSPLYDQAADWLNPIAI